ncbi:MAG: hypothetical protein ACRDF7_02130 [Candidatus Limnocylindrales bacterium]
MTDQQPPAETPPANDPAVPPEMPAAMPAAADAQPAMVPAQPAMSAAPPAMDAPPPAMGSMAPAAPPPTGWVQPDAAATPAPGGAWVMPQVAKQGGVTGPSKLGALVLIVFGVLWALIGVVIIFGGSVVNSLPGFESQLGTLTAGSLAGIIVGVGIVVLFIAIVEVLAGVFAWRGSGVARFIGMVYGLVFGLGTLASLAQAGNTSVGDAASGSAFILVFAIGYLYVLAVFIFRWRKAA